MILRCGHRQLWWSDSRSKPWTQNRSLLATHFFSLSLYTSLRDPNSIHRPKSIPLQLSAIHFTLSHFLLYSWSRTTSLALLVRFFFYSALVQNIQPTRSPLVSHITCPIANLDSRWVPAQHDTLLGMLHHRFLSPPDCPAPSLRALLQLILPFPWNRAPPPLSPHLAFLFSVCWAPAGSAVLQRLPLCASTHARAPATAVASSCNAPAGALRPAPCAA